MGVFLGDPFFEDRRSARSKWIAGVVIFVENGGLAGGLDVIAVIAVIAAPFTT